MRKDHVVVVGAGLGGLSAALHLLGAGRRVTVLEREAVPGGRAGVLADGGYRFDTGPTVLTLPEVIEEAFAAVGERLADWLKLTRLDPAYRAFFHDGSSIDVIADRSRMVAEIAAVCGPREAEGYLRFADYAQRLWLLQRKEFIERNFDGPRDLLTMGLLRLAAAGGFGKLDRVIRRFFRDPRTQRIFTFQALYAGLAPQQALAMYAVIAYLDTISGVYYPMGGMHSVPGAMAAAAAKHGAEILYSREVERVEERGGRAVAVITSGGERFEADAVVLNPENHVPQGRVRYSPSCVVLHVGSGTPYAHTSHHNIHFGEAWRRTFREVIGEGQLMSDPSLLVTNPSRSDASLAPPGHHTYYVLAPVPNLVAGRGLGWDQAFTQAYADSLLETLERRGYTRFRDGIQVLHTVTPRDWAALGLPGGTPFSAAHTMRQTGPFRAGNRHARLENVVYAGSGTRPGVGVPMVVISGKLAAERITGSPSTP
jgi:phytoene desaturase